MHRFIWKPSLYINSVVISAPCRRKSIEFEDVHDVLRSSSFSRATEDSLSCSPSTSQIREQNGIGDWLAHPDAISSVRRMRKSVNEQSHRKLIRKSSVESQHSNDSPIASGNVSPIIRSRTNSLSYKVTKSNLADHDANNSPRGKKYGRRGGSLKERRVNGQTPQTDNIENLKPLAKSHSVLSKLSCSLGEINEGMERVRSESFSSVRSGAKLTRKVQK